MVHLDLIVTLSGTLWKKCFIESVSARKWTKCFANFHKNVCWTRIEKNWRNLFWKQKIFSPCFRSFFCFGILKQKRGRARKKYRGPDFFFESTANSGQSMSTDKFFSKWCNSLLHEIEVHLDLKKRKLGTVSFVPSHWSLSSWKINRLFEKEREREREGEKGQEDTDADWKYDRGSEKDGGWAVWKEV